MTADRAAKVLYCEGNTDGTIGGSYYSLLYLVEGLAGSRYRPTVIFHREHRLLPRFEKACHDVRVVPRPAAFRLPPPGSCLNRLPGPLRAPLRLLQRGLNGALFLVDVVRFALLLKRAGIALVHLNNSVTRAHDWMLAACVSGTPYVVHERGINEQYSFLARRLARRASAVICISRAVRATLEEHRVTEGNLHVIENGLDPARVAPRAAPGDLRRSLGIPESSRVIGLVGNIKEWKGQEVVVRALPAIVEQVPGVVCLFVGASSEVDRPYESRLRELIVGQGLEGRVVFTGYRQNVADFLNLMEVAIHASILPEPFGRVLLEAMAMRKPIVGSRAGAVPEVVEHGTTGYTFGPGNSEELAACVSDLLQRPSTARAFGEAGYARLLERFSIGANVTRTLRLYDEITNATRIGARRS